MKNILSTIQISQKAPSIQTVILTAPHNLQQARYNIPAITEEPNVLLKPQLANIEEERHNCLLEQIPEKHREMIDWDSSEIIGEQLDV